MNAEAPYLSSFAGGHCLSTSALRQYIDGTLPKKSLHLVEKHLLDCDFCSHILEDMDVSENAGDAVGRISFKVNERISELVGNAPKLSLWARYRYYFVGGGAAMLLTGGAFLIHNLNSATDANTGLKTDLPVHPVSVTAPASVVSPSTTTAPVETSSPVSLSKEVKSEPVLKKEPEAAKIETPKETAPVKTVTETPVKPAEPPVAETKVSPPAPVAEKKEPTPPVNYADLQIVNVKVITKMTKSESSSRGSAKGGQLAKSKNRGGATFLPEEMPDYPGGESAMQQYIEQNFKNPVKDKRTLNGNAVGVMFTVSSKGKISDVEISKSIGKELDSEILRLISSMPQWTPAAHKGDITCVLALTVK